MLFAAARTLGPLCLLLTAAGLLWGCEHKELHSPEARRPLIVYMALDNDLKDEYNARLNALRSGWRAGMEVWIYADTPSGAALSHLEGTASGVEVRTADTYGAENSASGATLERVLRTVWERCPATGYGLLFFSHATGWLPEGALARPFAEAAAAAQGAEGASSRSIGCDGSAEMSPQAFAAAIPEGMPIDYIAFEACLMAGAEVALELLLTQDPDRAEALAQTLCDLNRERQTIEGDIFQQCVQRLTEHPQSGAIVLADQQWHQGVVGIVASRLAEQFACPTFMVCLDQGMGKGSCRSWGGVNLFQMLQSCAPLLESFGGHAMAAGFTVREENIPALADALRRAVEAAPKQAASCLEADAAVLPESLTVPAVEELDLLEPWGAGNPRPVLVLPGTQVVSAVAVGRGRHLKLRLESRGVPLDAIWFSNDGAGLDLEPGSRLDVAFCPQINEFRGLRSVQLQVMDLRPAPSRAQLERDVYEKFSRGEALSPAEAELLLPQRAEFVGLWCWLERRCGSALTMEDSLPHIARGAGRAVGRREAPVRTLVCLEVLEERGLIDLDRQTDRVRVVLHRLEHKVDLESSALLLRLRQAAEDRA